MKRFRVEWAQPAKKDLENIIDYVSRDDDVDTAVTIFVKIRSRCDTLKRVTARGRVVPDLKAYGILDYRELIVSHWRVVFRISDKRVYVVAVIDSRRNIDDILIERFL